MKKQLGFTLIELAIVLVIIGLLLAGVLKGQELINSAKVKNMASDFKNTQVLLYGYQDKFRALPGDDAAVVTHLGAAATVATTPGTPGNGLIEGDWNSSTVTDESYLFWQHVRMAGLAPGMIDATVAAPYVPRNVDGGRTGIQSVSGLNNTVLVAPGTAGGISGSYAVCSGDILGKFAKQLDTALDDGNGQTGSMRIVLPGTPSIGLANAADSTAYVVCLAF